MRRSRDLAQEQPAVRQQRAHPLPRPHPQHLAPGARWVNPDNTEMFASTPRFIQSATFANKTFAVCSDNKGAKLGEHGTNLLTN